MARVIGIWISGLFASAMTGAVIAHHFYALNADVTGSVAGMAAFTCIRLWATENEERKQNG